MKKLVLLFALLACVVVVDDVRGEVEISLEDWCKEQGQTWDAGTCMIERDTFSYLAGVAQLYIGKDQGLVVNGTLRIGSSARIDNAGSIIVRGYMENRSLIYIHEGAEITNVGHIRNCAAPIPHLSLKGTVENDGTIYNAGYFENDYFQPKPYLVCFGYINNRRPGAIYTFRSIYTYPTHVENMGVVYHFPCNGGGIRDSDWPFEIIALGGTTIDLDLCVYLPMMAMH